MCRYASEKGRSFIIKMHRNRLAAGLHQSKWTRWERAYITALIRPSITIGVNFYKAARLEPPPTF